jgi:hypothetical protein
MIFFFLKSNGQAGYVVFLQDVWPFFFMEIGLVQTLVVG